MDCPVCRSSLITLELDQVEIDHCTECGGIWLDKGELELLLAGAQSAEELLATLAVDKSCREKPRPCPLCAKKMDKVSVGADAPVLVDRCPHNDGIWFDAGELPAILTKARLDKDHKIQKLLADMFGGR